LLTPRRFYGRRRRGPVGRGCERRWR